MLVPSLNFAGKTREAQRQSRVRELPPSLAGNECRPATPQRHLPRLAVEEVQALDIRASAPPAPPIDQPKNQQKHDGADRGRDDRGDDATSKMNAQFRQ